MIRYELVFTRDFNTVYAVLDSGYDSIQATKHVSWPKWVILQLLVSASMSYGNVQNMLI